MKKLLNMIERWNPLFAVTQVTRKVPPKHVHLMTARAWTLKIKQHMIERWHPLSAVTQVTSQVTSNQCWTRWTLTSEYLDCHILFWNKLRTLVFENWSRRSRTTPHRHALQRDLQQNKAYNPFSTMTKQMIQDVGNVELFELFETDPKTQCTECLSHWSEGIVYCTCGHLLKEIEVSLNIHWTFLEYVIKKGRPHGHRYGKKPEKKEYHLAHNLKKRCIKKRFTGIHDRFLRDHDFRKCMLGHDRDEDVCLKWGDQNTSLQTKLVDHSQLSLETLADHWEKRSDFNQALSTLNRLHRESGGQQLRPMPYWKYQQRQPSSSSSSTSWQWSGSWWSS